MTLHELSQLYYLQKEIDQYDRRIDALRAQRAAISAPAYSGDPPGKRKGGAQDSKIERLTADIVDLEELLHLSRRKRVTELKRLERFISEVDDSTVRQIMRHRFGELLSWNATASRMGAGYTVDALKKMLYRYLEKHADD